MNVNFVEYIVKQRVAYISLNRPEKRNAFNQQLVNELKIAFTSAEKDNNVKIIVLGGNGKAFSAGADLAYIQSLQKYTYEENLADSNNLKELYQQIYTCPKITIAKVKGHAIAGGAGLATVCDFAYATPQILLGYTEVKIGFIPAIVMVFLLRKINEAKAKELLLTGKLITSNEAKQIGLISEIIPAEEIDSKVHDIALELAATTSVQSIANTKEMIQKVQQLSIAEGFNYAAEMNAKGRGNEDCKNGIAAFLNKEEIKW